MRIVRRASSVVSLVCAAALTECARSTWSDLVAAYVTVEAGNSQSGIAAQALAQPLSVRVSTDLAGATAVPGVPVMWSIGSGGGSLSRAVDTTNADGMSSVTWVLGTTVGTQTATATVSDLSGSPVTFTATAAAVPPTQIALVSGNNQTANVGTALAAPLVVKVSDAANAGVVGATVSWAVTSGGGAVWAGTSVTDAAGHAQMNWTLGPTVGAQTATATVSGLAGSPVAFSATGTAVPPTATQMALASGNNQTQAAGTTLAAPLVVKVADASNAGVAGVTVSWAVTVGGGTASATTSVTNASGNAQVNWTLGATVGTQTATATVSGLTGSPVTFSATGTAVAPTATQIALASGNGQTGTVGTALAAPLVVKVSDASNAGVAGITVNWAVTLGGGTVSTGTSVTNASGNAQVTWTLGATVGTQSATATVAGLAGSPVSFSATGTAVSSPATQIARVSGNNQTGTVGTGLAAPLVVKVADASNVGVAGVTVGWAVTLGGGAVSTGTSVTSASGNAQVNWTLGATVGAQTATATVSGLAGSPVTFTATGVASTAAQITVQSGNGQTGTVSTDLASPLVVKVGDASNVGVAGITVNWAVTSGGGTVSTTTSVTNASGNAAAFWTLGPAAGTNTVAATVSGLAGSPVTFTATGTVVQAGDCSSSLSNVALPLCDGTYTQAITPSTFPANSVIQAQHPGKVRFTGTFNSGSGLTFRGIVVTYADEKSLGAGGVYEDMSFVGGPACGNTVNTGAASGVTIRRSAFYGRGGRYQLLIWHESGVTLENVIFRSDGGWGEGGHACDEYEPNATLNDYDSPNFLCSGCVLFDGITTAASSELLGGLGVNCHSVTSTMTFENSLIVNSHGGFYAEGHDTCNNVVVRNSASWQSVFGYNRNVAGATQLINFSSDGGCGNWNGSTTMVDSKVSGPIDGCSGATNGTGASITLNTAFLDNPRWRREMCDDAGVTRGWCATTKTLSEYLTVR